LASPNPIKAINTFFTGIFSSKFYVGTFLNTTTIFLFASLGCAIAIKSGNMNLGGAAQIYVSGFLCALLLQNSNFSFFVALLICSVVSGLIAAISGFLKAYKNINELLSSFLISAAIIPFIDYAISGPFRDTSKNLLATKTIAENHFIKLIMPPSPFNYTFFIAIALCFFVYYLLYHTYFGKQLCLCEHSFEFAQYCGYNTKLITISAMFLSGMLHGIAGFFAVTGNYHTCHSGFYSNMNWDAIAMSLIAINNPLLLIPSTLLMSFIFTAGDYTAMIFNFSFDTNSLIQAIIFFTISAKFFISKNESKIKIMKWNNFLNKRKNIK